MKRLSLLTVLSLIFFSCTQPNKQTSNASFQLLKKASRVGLFESQNLSVICAVSENNVIYFTNKDGVFMINPAEKTERKIITNGPGPREIINPSGLTVSNQMIYVFSENSTTHILKINPQNNFQIERIDISDYPISIDHLGIYKNTYIVGNLYWKDGLLREYINGAPKTISTSIKPTWIDLMMTFNVSDLSFTIDADNLYYIESIKPEITCIDLKKKEIVQKFSLIHPKYAGLRTDYKKHKFSDKSHKEWMSKCSLLRGIQKKDNWLLIRYRWGYEPRFFYELLDIKNPSAHFIIEESSDYIYDFVCVENKTFHFSAVDFSENEQSKWFNSAYTVQ